MEIDVQSGDEKLSDEEEPYLDGDANSESCQLDQTIVIGEMEEGNIFEQIKTSSGEESSKDISMSKLDLEQLLTDLKLKHRAEIDAIMLEQGIYKKII